jgi:hypothetical protein
LENLTSKLTASEFCRETEKILNAAGLIIWIITHGKVVPADKLVGLFKARILDKEPIAAQIAGVLVLPEDPDGNRLNNQLQHLPGLLKPLRSFL